MAQHLSYGKRNIWPGYRDRGRKSDSKQAE